MNTDKLLEAIKKLNSEHVWYGTDAEGITHVYEAKRDPDSCDPFEAWDEMPHVMDNHGRTPYGRGKLPEGIGRDDVAAWCEREGHPYYNARDYIAWRDDGDWSELMPYKLRCESVRNECLYVWDAWRDGDVWGYVAYVAHEWHDDHGETLVTLDRLPDNDVFDVWYGEESISADDISTDAELKLEVAQ